MSYEKAFYYYGNHHNHSVIRQVWRLQIVLNVVISVIALVVHEMYHVLQIVIISIGYI